MLLSINEAKVAELLKSGGGGYKVNSLELPMVVEDCQPETITAEVSGIVYAYGGSVDAQPKEDVVFGTHVREAVGIVKDWAGRK